MDLQLINFTETDSVITIYLNQLNNGLFNMEAILEFTHLLHYIEDESKYKFVIIRGSKTCFNKGLDINNLDSKKITIDSFRKWEIALRTIEKINKVTIAVIEGDCFGAGIQLALACDIRIATNDTKFTHNEAKLGILPGLIVFQLGKFCGLGKMMELIQTGRVYSAKEAVEWGIIHGSYDNSEVEEEIANLLRKYKSIDINIHMLIRRLSKESFEMSYEDFLGCYLAAQHRTISSLNVNFAGSSISNEIKTEK